jgi:hypothetical protein
VLYPLSYEGGPGRVTGRPFVEEALMLHDSGYRMWFDLAMEDAEARREASLTPCVADPVSSRMTHAIAIQASLDGERR